MVVKAYGLLEVMAEATGATAIRAKAWFIPDAAQGQSGLLSGEVNGFLNLLFATIAVTVLAGLSAAPLAYLCVGLLGGILVVQGLRLYFRRQGFLLAKQQVAANQIGQSTERQS